MRPVRIVTQLAVLVALLAACAPAGAQTEPPPTVSAVPSLAAPSATPSDDLTSAVPPAAPTVQVIATSRGPNLEATDPKTVSIASGGLQFVEFFEFW